MENLEVALVIALAALIAVVALVGLVARPRRARRRPPETRPDIGRRPARGSTAEDPRDRPSAPVATAPRPEAPADPMDLDLLTEPPPGPVLERPAPLAGRLTRLRARLARSQTLLGQGLLALLTRERLDEDTWDEVEETLLSADIGVAPTHELMERLRTRVKVLGTRSPDEVTSLVREELLELVGPDLDRSLHTARRVEDNRPAIVLVVGVNGTGKTTTAGKLARVLVAEDRDVLLGAADTFRAAAADQLQTWGDRVGAPTVRGPEGGDPASVAFEAVKQGVEMEVDTVVIDTAGRLHTKTGLMDELGKVKRVVERYGPIDEVLLVLDATTGQNGLTQARVFAEVVDVTGIVLTKLDGTAKGGIVIAVQRQLGVPVKLVGLGEGPDDLAPFEPTTFVDAIIGG